MSNDRLNGLLTSVAIKPPVQAVTNAAITLSGEQTVGGIAVVDGDRVLVKDQADAVDNGIYVVSTGTWSRSADFDGNRDVVTGTRVLHETASVMYRVTAANPIVIGTSEINFSEESSGLSTVVSVTDYGAAGDGVNDDTDAIQAAIDACESSGASLYIPSGTYLTSSSLTIDVANGITVYGDGYNSVIKGTNAGTYIILLVQRTGFTAINGLRLSNFRIDGNDGGQLDAGLLVLNNVVGGVIDRLWIENGTRVSGSSGVNGISISAGTTGGTGSEVVVRDCYIRNTSKGAINFTSESVEGLITGNHIEDIDGNGTAPGIQLNGGFNCRVVGNYIKNTEGPGIYVATDSLSNPSRNAIIAHNVIDTCGVSSSTQGDGIRVTSSSQSVGRMIISGNNIYDCGTNTNGGSGIYVIDTDNIEIMGNLCRNNRYDGLRIEGCNYVNVSGNRFTGNNLAAASYAGGITVKDVCAHVSIIGNNCSDDKSTKTQSYGIILAASATLTYLTIEANHLEGNSNGPLLANSGAKPMFVRMVGEKQTTGGTASTMQYFTLPDECACFLSARSVGKKSDGSDRAIYSAEGLFYRDGGNATQEGATTTLGTDIESDAAWGGLSFGVSSNLALVQVAGLAATTIDWRADISLRVI